MKKVKVLGFIIALILIFTSTIVFAEGESTDVVTDDKGTFELEMDTETGETEFYRGETINLKILMKSDNTQTGIQGFDADFKYNTDIFELQKNNNVNNSYSETGKCEVEVTEERIVVNSVLLDNIQEDEKIVTIPFKIKEDAVLGKVTFVMENIIGGYINENLEDYSYSGDCDDLEIEILEGKPSENSQDEGETLEITKIEVVEEPDNTEYQVGDKFTPDGMEFKVIYSNGEEKTIIYGDTDNGLSDNEILTWEPDEELTIDDDKIVFNYEDEDGNEKSFEIKITVADSEEPTEEPTENPTEEPTKNPTKNQTQKPTENSTKNEEKKESKNETQKSNSEEKKETSKADVENKETKEVDNKANGKIPQTGMPSIIIPSTIGIALIIVAVVCYKKYKKMF